MEALKLKIFDVLIRKITVIEFENWLYYSEEILGSIEKDSLVFRIVTINYKMPNALRTLENIVLELFDDEDLTVVEIERTCVKISESTNVESSYAALLNLMENFDYHTELNVLWGFYRLKNDYCLIEIGSVTSNQFYSDVKKLARGTLNKLGTCKDLQRKKEMLLRKEDEEAKWVKNVGKSRKKECNVSFKNKFLAFFKKI